MFIFGRELTCTYDTDSSKLLWTAFSRCLLSSADLSDKYQTVDHSFSSTQTEKSLVTVVNFDSPSKMDFLPKEILSEFPKFNGIEIKRCYTFTIIKDDFFSKDFGAIEYLYLGDNRVETIEANAFQHLPDLKWIWLARNQIRSFPYRIFKNNPEIFVIWLHANKINSITPDFFQDLDKLRHVEFQANTCVKKDFGCDSGYCSVSQSELDDGLSDCYTNCLNEVECASKSGKLDNLSPEKIERNIDVIISSRHLQTLVEQNYTVQLIKSFKNTMDSELRTLKEEMAALRNQLAEVKECNNNVTDTRMEFGEWVQKKFTEFAEKLMGKS